MEPVIARPSPSSSGRRSSTKRKSTNAVRRSTSKSPMARSSPAKRKNNRRRSSIKRRSLVATLECVQSRRSPRLSGGIREINIHATLPAMHEEPKEKAGQLTTNLDSKHAEEHDSNTKTAAGLESQSKATTKVIAAVKQNKVSTEEHDKDLSAVAAPEQVKTDEKHTTRLKSELQNWIKEKQKYEQLEEGAREEARSRIYFPPSELEADASLSKYDVYLEQIDDLTDQFTSAAETVSNTMNMIHQIKQYHELNLKKAKEAEYLKVCNARGGDDPRWLIESLFKLDQNGNEQ